MKEEIIPIVIAKKINNKQVKIKCPYCKKEHIHGNPDDKGGHRLSHCDDARDNPGYILKMEGK
jgi:transposase-like protein